VWVICWNAFTVNSTRPRDFSTMRASVRASGMR
jgi:hypothetical protein